MAEGAFVDTEQHDADVRSDQVHWLSEAGDGRMPWAARPREGLQSVLRAMRSVAAGLEQHGTQCGSAPSLLHAWLGDLGVPRNAQLARYVPPCRHAPGNSPAEARGASRGVEAAEAAASHAVVRATGGARYTAHRDGLPLHETSPALLLTNPGVCMRNVTAIVYLTAPPADGGWGGAHEAGAAPTPGRPPAAQRHAVAPGGAAARVAQLQPGALVLYLGTAADDTSGCTASEVVEVLPVGGRCVLFDSRVVLHEVLPNTRPDVERLAVTCWLGGPSDVAGLSRWLRRVWHSRAEVRGAQ